METEGLFTTIWGPGQWESLHNITFNYPYNPTEQDKKKYFDYFISLGNVLPCCSCRKHYNFHIKNGKTALTDKVLESRDSLTLWVFNLHKEVCDRLGYNYDITFDMICEKHNSYIAKCELTPEQKIIAYKNLYDIHAPVVKADVLLCLADYAKSKGLNEFVNNVKYFSSLDRKSNEWYNRNQRCQELIKQMRINGLISIEESGEFKGMPTVHELKLMELTSTTLPKKTIKHMLKTMGCKVKKTYKLINN